MCRKGAGTKVGEMHTKTLHTYVVLEKKKKGDTVSLQIQQKEIGSLEFAIWT